MQSSENREPRVENRQIKERPILFSGEMVRAILDGRKTMTRRVLKFQPLDILPMKTPNEWVILETKDPEPHGKVIRCRFGKPGDRLWVRETCLIYCEPRRLCPNGEVEYKADYPKNATACPGWKPSIFMPRWASRILLEVVSVCVERLQDITEEDAIAEGFGKPILMESNHYACVDFRLYWDLINSKKHPWESNPWVWVVEFKRIEG